MSSSIAGSRDLPVSRYNLSTYWGRVKHAADISDPRTLITSSTQLQHAKDLLAAYKHGQLKQMTPELWRAKKVVDATLHPDTGEPVLLPFRMSCFVFSNLIVTAGMLTPGLGPIGTVSWQIANQSLNVAINSANANKSSPLSTSELATSYLLAVGASCGVALGLKSLIPRLKRLSPTARTTLGRLVPFAAVASAGALNVFLMRGQEIRTGIDVYPVKDGGSSINADEDVESIKGRSPGSHSEGKEPGNNARKSIGMGIGSEAFGKKLSRPREMKDDTNTKPRSSSSLTSSASEDLKPSLGKSKIAAKLAVAETALSRVMNAMPVMVLPPLVLIRLQRTDWLAKRPRLVLPVNLGLIFATSIFALPLALAIFPQRQTVRASRLEERFWDVTSDGERGSGRERLVEFNRGI